MKLTTRPCPLCGATNYEDTGAGVREFLGPRVAQCLGCQLVVLNPVMTDEEYTDFYNADAQRRFVQNITKDDYATKVSQNDYRRAGFVSATCSSGTILDVGSGLSGFVGLLPNAIGIDVSESRVAAAQARGLPVELCDINDWSKTMDTITMFHVLEHMINPLEALSKTRSLLAQGGRLVIEVPNLNDILVRLPAYRKFYYQNAHCTYFTPQTLSEMLNRAGLMVEEFVKIQRYSFDNHLHWLLKSAPGKIDSVRCFNPLYSWVLKALEAYDTILVVCYKG